MTNDSDAENQPEEQDDDDSVHCPVCQTHTVADNLAAQGLVISGLKALFSGDMETVGSLYEILTPYDAHTAIGFAAALLNDICVMTGLDVDTFLDGYRKGLNHAQATID